MRNFTIHFDGSCWPNPSGTAAYGYTIDEVGQDVRHGSGVIGAGPTMSNNVAEFHALTMAFQRLRCDNLISQHDKISVYGDSNLVIQIMNKRWRASSDKLYYPYYCTLKMFADLLVSHDAEITYGWIPREKNTRCDDLSKEHNKSQK